MADSFAYRRYHIHRALDIDIASHGDPLSRAIESYLSWMDIAEQANPIATLRVEHAIDDIQASALKLQSLPLCLDQYSVDRARLVSTKTNATEGRDRFSFTPSKPVLTSADFAAVDPALRARLIAFCEKYGYSTQAYSG